MDRNRSIIDRRSDNERRQVYSLDYFLHGGEERRCGGERRNKQADRRSNWVKVNGWCSIPSEF